MTSALTEILILSLLGLAAATALGALGVRFTDEYVPKVDRVHWSANRTLGMVLAGALCLAAAASAAAEKYHGNGPAFLSPAYFVLLGLGLAFLAFGPRGAGGLRSAQGLPLLRQPLFCRLSAGVSALSWLVAITITWPMLVAA